MSDYISRDKVAQAFEDADVDVCEDYGEYYGCEWGFSRDAVRKIVAELPAADVAPVRHGWWIPSDYVGDCCYTCSECGFERDAYLLDVGDYCPECGARMDKEANMNKPLSEWTLGEVKAECEKHTAHCVGCPLWTDAAGCRLDTSCYRDNDPKKWDLSEPPRWTEQDKEDAMMIKRLIPWANQVNRGMEGSLSLNPVTAIDRKLFPLLKPGESAMLDEIIGGGE